MNRVGQVWESFYHSDIFVVVEPAEVTSDGWYQHQILSLTRDERRTWGEHPQGAWETSDLMRRIA